MKVVTVRDFRDRASEMFHSDDVILVTRDGAPAGFFLPWDTPELPVEVRREVFLRLSEQIGAQLGAQGARAALQVMPVDWKPAADYDDQREEAEQRIAARDPDDWPSVALALTLGLPVWSQDKDLTDAGFDVFTTGGLLDALRDL